MKRSLRLRIAAVTTSILAVMTTVACATAGSSGSARGREDCVTPGISPQNVKLGLVFPNSGALAAPFRAVRSGVEARIALANATGGVHGRLINLEWRDDESNAGGNLIASRDLVENAGVFGLLQETSFVSTSAEYLSTTGIPVTGLVAEPVWGKYRNMFAVSNPYAEGPAITTFGLYAKQQGGTRAYLLETRLRASSRTAADRYAASLASQGIPVVTRADYTDKVTDPARIAAEIKRSGADVIVGAISGNGLASVVKAAREIGVPFKVAFGPDGYYQSLLAQYGRSVAGMTVYIGFTPFESRSAAQDTYRNAMVRYAPELGDPNQATAVEGYITTDLFLRGLTAAGECPTREGFIEALRAVRDYDAGGLLPAPIDMARSSAELSRCYFFVRVNEVGTGFETVPSRSGVGTDQWCGELATNR